MNTYTVVYGGQQRIEAESMQEAYEKFWAWCIEKAQAGEVGVIVCQTCQGSGEIQPSAEDGYEPCPDCVERILQNRWIRHDGVSDGS